ncbi:nuclear transport factor 2 family protein [Nocardia sp. 348MFTsu5.1]|uniref:nuclear transport factor 2 family protein n=1 Tax=Nocardia sp. 348MFTsu5.1 TaxID=1172185 RepID=UPI000374D1BA|nr:nuclear transport factor 2 family protein [Nocardia sp. 348MFTsu5.1]
MSDSQMADLIDKQSLYENMALYCRGMDRKDLMTMKSTFWPEATDNHGSFVGSAHEFCEWACENQKKGHHRSHHYISNVLIELDGATARRETAVVYAMVRPDEDRIEVMGGRYRDLCEKRQGEWKVLRRVVIFDFAQQHSPIADFGAVFGGIPPTSRFGELFPTDPFYDAEW